MNNNSSVQMNSMERAILEIERGHWGKYTKRDEAIEKLTGLSTFQYYVILSDLLNRPYFWEADPVLVDRLRRLRDRKLRERMIVG